MATNFGCTPKRRLVCPGESGVGRSVSKVRLVCPDVCVSRETPKSTVNFLKSGLQWTTANPESPVKSRQTLDNPVCNESL